LFRNHKIWRTQQLQPIKRKEADLKVDLAAIVAAEEAVVAEVVVAAEVVVEVVAVPDAVAKKSQRDGLLSLN
jgi:hypothetical protein